MKITALFLLTSVLLFTACEDSDSDADSENEVIPSPIHGSWELIEWEVKTLDPPTGWMPNEEECRLDDVEIYDADGSWTRYDGTYVCPGGDGTGIFSGTWQFTANNTIVLYTYAGIPGEYQSSIDVLTDTSMVLTFASGSLDGMQNRVTYSKL